MPDAKLCVEWESTNTSWHINVSLCENFHAYTKCMRSLIIILKLNIGEIWQWICKSRAAGYDNSLSFQATAFAFRSAEVPECGSVLNYIICILFCFRATYIPATFANLVVPVCLLQQTWLKKRWSESRKFRAILPGVMPPDHSTLSILTRTFNIRPYHCMTLPTSIPVSGPPPA